jgi:hypothetical protein
MNPDCPCGCFDAEQHAATKRLHAWFRHRMRLVIDPPPAPDVETVRQAKRKAAASGSERVR